MSTYSPDHPDFQEWESDAFMGLEPTLPSVTQEDQRAAAEQEALAYDLRFIEQRMRNLGMLQGWQYHRVPLEGGQLEVVVAGLGHRMEQSDSHETLRIIQNIKTERILPTSVAIKDYVLYRSNKNLAVRRQRVSLGDVQDITAAAGPVIWRTTDSGTGVFGEKGYALPFVRYDEGRSRLDILKSQRSEAADLEKLLASLSREVTLEQERPYK